MNFAKPSVLSDSLKTTPVSALSQPSALDTAGGVGLSPLAGWSGASEASAIAFVDASVTDYQTLVADIAPGTEVHILNSSQDAVTQITNTLLGRHNISSLHIISHGEAGGLDFGNSVLNLADLPQYAAQIQGWSKALTDDADLLLYGCNVAQGELGKAFVQILSRLTGADTAASDNLTGSSALGGDWKLEYQTGDIQTPLAFLSSIAQTYHYDLAVNVAVIAPTNATNTGYTAIVNQLNDNTFGFNFNATLITPTAADTVAKLSAYDAVVIGGYGFPDSTYISTIAPALRSWVEGGGGLVATGWLAYEYDNTDLDAILPVSTQGVPPTVSPGSQLTITDPNNPVTTGVSSFTNASFIETPIGIQAGATLLGTAGGNTGVAIDQLAAGRSVYLGSIYTGDPSYYDNGDLRSGNADRLLEQAVNWVAVQAAFRNLPNSVGFTENGVALTLAPSLTANMSPDATAYTTNGASVQFDSGFSAGDSLSIGGAGATSGSIGGTSINWSYDTNTGALSFSGTDTIANYITALRQVTYVNTSEAPSTTPRQLTYSINRQNKYYEYVSTASTWTQAQQAAASRNFLGLKGYLATITSAAENTTVDALSGSSGWIGASDAATEGDWRWVTGPEATTQFWQGAATGNTVGGQYANWSTGEPNNSGGAENYGELSSAGTWNDLPITSTEGYFVEYGGLSSDRAAIGTVTINVTAVNDAPTVSAPPAIAVIEDTPIVLTGISFADVDAGSGAMTAVMSVGAGSLAATAGNGVTVVGSASSSITLNGTLTALNSFLTNSLTYTPALNNVATQTLGITVNDSGNTGSGGPLSSVVTNVNLMVTAVNDAPSFIKGADQTITVGAGSQTITNWATGFNPGPTDEAGQTVQAYEIVSNDHSELFAVAPTINNFGNLIYTPTTNVAVPTTATVGVRVRDNGGTANSGIDTSTVQTFTITVKPKPTISITPVSHSEGNSGTTLYTFTVSLSDTSTQTVMVNYATADGTATIADGDYTAAAGTLSFAPGETSKTFTVLANGDTTYENTEAFLVTLSNASNGVIGSSTVNGTITNDDANPVLNITPSITHVEGNTGTTPYNFTVTLSNPSFEAIGITYSTSDGTATVANGDYTAATGTLNFAPGETSKTITVNANGDTNVESNETFQVALTGTASGSGAVTPGVLTGTGTIVDDDLPAISISNVSLSEGNSGTRFYTFTVSLSSASYQTVSLNYATADGTATVADGDYKAANGTLSFAPGETSKNITVLVNGDTKFEVDQAFSVGLSNASNATFNTSTGTGTIVNDDMRPTINITPVISQNEGNSGTTAYTFTASLSNTSDETITVNYATADGTAAVADGDYTAAAGTLSFASGETSKTLTVLAKGDTRMEQNETFVVNLTAPTNATIAAGAGTGTIVNDDSVNLVWRSGTTGSAPSGTGANVLWQMNGFTRQSSVSLLTVTDLNWQIVGRADFNGDGSTDLLWRNQANGNNVIWQLNNNTVQTTYQITSVNNLNWQVAGTADFNLDGKPDILWRNRATGENTIWQLNGATLQSSRSISSASDLNWQIVDTADFNNDGTPDILWRNRATGENTIWRMNNFSLQTSYRLLQVADLNWQIAGTGDFNNDGIADIIWSNKATGKSILWQMNSTGRQSEYTIRAAADPNWQIAGIADFNGDGTPDILWRNQQASREQIWQMSGFSFSQAYQLPDVTSEWVVKTLPLA